MDDKLAEILRVLGRLEEGQKNTTAYIGAVSQNVKDVRLDLADHRDDDGAHGIRTTIRNIKIVGIFLGILEALHFIKK